MNEKTSALHSSQDRDPKVFPDELQGLHDTLITCLNLTNDFLCFGTDVSFFLYLVRCETIFFTFEVEILFYVKLYFI